MAALTKDVVPFPKRDAGQFSTHPLPVKGGAKIFAGALVSIEVASGYAIAATGDNAAEAFAGIALRQADATGLANGAITVEVIPHAILKGVTIAAAAITDFGKTVYASTDNIADATITSGAGADLPIGAIHRFVSTNVVDLIVRCDALAA